MLSNILMKICGGLLVHWLGYTGTQKDCRRDVREAVVRVHSPQNGGDTLIETNHICRILH